MPIIKTTSNAKLEKPEAAHNAWEQAYWRLATIIDLWMAQISKGHTVVSGGHLALNVLAVELDATVAAFTGQATTHAVGPSTPIAALVGGNTYVIYVDNAGAVQVSALDAAGLWSGALPTDFVLLGAVYEVEGAWTIHNLPLGLGRGLTNGLVGIAADGSVNADGVVLKDGAVTPDLGGDFKNGTDPITGYPSGYSLFSVGSATGWPASAGMVVTHNRGTSDGRSIQYFMTSSGDLHYRSWVTSAWIAFRAFESRDKKGVAGGYVGIAANGSATVSGVALYLSAVQVDLGGDFKNGPDSLTEYPSGISYFSVGSATGWPDSAGMVVTINRGTSDGRSVQYFMTSSGDLLYRSWVTSAWIAFRAFESRNQKGVAGGYLGLESDGSIKRNKIDEFTPGEGVTIDGLKIKDGGVLPEITGKAATDAGTTYPAGLTTFRVGGSSGWPGAGMVISFNVLASGGNFLQLWVGDASGGHQQRCWTGSAWGAWITPEKKSDKGAASGYASLNASSQLVEALQDNAVTQAKIAAAAVGQGELKTALQQETGSLVAGNAVSIILTGGAYSLGFGIEGYATLKAGGDTTYGWRVRLHNETGITYSYYFQTRFFQASPPYNLGNGEIPLFVFAVVLPSGEFESISVVPDPPWANNGPTNIRPEFYRDKRTVTQQKKGPPSPTDLIPMKRVLSRPPRPALDAPAEEIAAWLEAVKNPVWEEVEITQAVKQADMPLIPHPFTGNDLTGKTVVLLDPVGPLAETLLALHEAGESVNDLLHEGYLKLDNAPLDCITPPGVTACPVAWKNTQ